jgi:adenylate kinase family enzyme
MNLKTIIFIGRSGSGKGTQAEKVKGFLELYDSRKVFHLEAGHRFRSFIAEENYSSLLARKVSEDGGLQPEFLSVWAWAGEIIRNVDKHDHLLIDGTPRRESEAKILESAFEFYNRSDIEIVYLNVSRKWAMDRMKERGRADDKELDDVKARMEWFEKDVSGVLDYYRLHKSHKFHEVNGEQSIEKVYLDIIKELGLKEYLDD